MAQSGTVQIEIPNIEKFAAALANFSSMATPIIQNAVLAGGATLGKYTTRGNVPYVTGNLLQSFRLQTGALFARWFPTANYANYVYFGTKPHLIVPKNGKALFWQGASHPVRSVNHPGSKGNPYIDTIAAAASPEIIALFQKAIQQITANIAAQTK